MNGWAAVAVFPRLALVTLIGLALMSAASCANAPEESAQENEKAAIKAYLSDMESPEASLTEVLGNLTRSVARPGQSAALTAERQLALNEAAEAIDGIEAPASLRAAHHQLQRDVGAWAASLEETRSKGRSVSAAGLKSEMLTGARVLGDWQMAVDKQCQAHGVHAPDFTDRSPSPWEVVP